MAENNVVHAFGSVPMSELQKEMLDKLEQIRVLTLRLGVSLR